MQITFIVVLIMTILLIAATVYTMAIFNYDFTSTLDYINKMNLMLQNKNLANLLNANSIGNLPVINIQTNNSEIQRMNDCANGPVFMGAVSDEFVCKRICGGAGKLLNVAYGDEVFFNGQKLSEGAWCTVNRPNCNLNTTFARATVNNVSCQTKYPFIFGGETGNRLIACNNIQHFSVNNILWDNLNNERVTSMTKLTHEDEKLPDGSYRFTCKFGDDENKNKFIENPSNRFHPVVNYCTKDIYDASPNIKLTPEGNCDCGNYQDTRVQNKIMNDPTSTCTACYDRYNETTNRLTIGTNCVTVNSKYTQLQRDTVCKPSKFINIGNLCELIELDVKYDDNKFPFHLLEKQMTGTRLLVKDFTSF